MPSRTRTLVAACLSSSRPQALAPLSSPQILVPPGRAATAFHRRPPVPPPAGAVTATATSSLPSHWHRPASLGSATLLYLPLSSLHPPVTHSRPRSFLLSSSPFRPDRPILPPQSPLPVRLTFPPIFLPPAGAILTPPGHQRPCLPPSHSSPAPSLPAAADGRLAPAPHGHRLNPRYPG